MTRMSVGTLPWWRALGEDGPESFKLGRRVMYRRTDVEKWLGEAQLMPDTRKPPREEPSALVLALRDHAAVNSVEQVGISPLSELSGEGLDSNDTQFVGVRGCPQTTGNAC